jgi:hypothetical protein
MWHYLIQSVSIYPADSHKYRPIRVLDYWVEESYSICRAGILDFWLIFEVLCNLLV